MATESAEVYPSTELFENGVTVPRVMQVVPILAAAMRGTCPELLPEAVSVHPGPDEEEVTHVGWPLYEGEMRIPRLDPKTRSITREIILATLYLSDVGNLGSCIVWRDGRYRDVDLNERILRQTDMEADYKTGRLSALRDIFNTRFVAKALTVAAFDLHNYVVERDGRPNDHILTTLKGFAASDNPRPDYAQGGPAGTETWPRI